MSSFDTKNIDLCTTTKLRLPSIFNLHTENQLPRSQYGGGGVDMFFSKPIIIISQQSFLKLFLVAGEVVAICAIMLFDHQVRRLIFSEFDLSIHSILWQF